MPCTAIKVLEKALLAPFDGDTVLGGEVLKNLATGDRVMRDLKFDYNEEESNSESLRAPDRSAF